MLSLEQHPTARSTTITRRAAAGAVLALALVLLMAPFADAGSYVVSACGAAPGGANNSWTPGASHGNLTAYSNPCAPISGGLIARAAANGASVPANSVATWSFVRPNAETVITGLELSGEIYRLGGDAFDTWGAGLYDNTGGYLWGGTAASYLHLGTGSGAYVPIGVDSRTALHMGVRCANGGGCTTASSGDQSQNYARARTALYGARVTLSNWAPPTVSGLRGALWTTNGWVGGTQSAGFDAADEVGVRRISLAIDADERASDSACDFTYTVPCPIARAHDASFNTAGLSDGVHTLWFRATDSAGNDGGDSRWIYVDNTAPAAPSAPALTGAPSSQWRTVNGFTHTYANPATGGGSDNIASDVQVCPADEQGSPQLTACTTFALGAAWGSNAFDVPSPGEFRARVRVRDHLYAGAWSDWGPVLRFDDVVPGAANPQSYDGWVSRPELAAGMTIEPPPPSARPASGYAGYAVRNDGAMPDAAVTATAGDSSGRATVDIASWADGIYAVKVRSVSVAGLAAKDSDVRSSTVKIDTASPGLLVKGAPDAGATINHTATLDVSATDALSGMAGAAAGEDVTKGAYLTHSIDGAPETRVRGATLRLTATDGRHSITFSAVDVAGNRSAAQTFTFTQDTAAPQGGLLPTDPNAPRRIAFFVAEECVAGASVELSTDGGESWRTLATELGPQLVTAAVPDDIWDARRPYTVRAHVTDCAGNRATLDRWYGGAADGRNIGTLALPLRAGVKLTAAFTRLELTRACTFVSKPRVVRSRVTGRTRVVRRRVKVCPRVTGPAAATASAKKVMSRTREVYGVLTDAGGRPLAGREVQVQTQPKTVGARWNIVRVERTDSRGLISVRVRKFTSLRVRLVAPRDETFDTGTSSTLVTHVTARSTIRATPRSLRNGQIVRLAGRVQGGHVPAAGMQIALYGYSPSKKRWLPVRTTVKVDPRGNWTALYRFTATGAKATYRFRVRIAGRATFPFATGYSRTVRVVVRP